MNSMKYIQLLLFVLCVLMTSCKQKLEKIETLDETTGEKVTYTRRTDNFGKQGLLIRTTKEGVKTEEAMYENDSLNGVRKLFYPDGKVFIEEHYVMGEFQGPWKTFYENGKVKLEGEYTDNAMEGIWKGYYETGALKEEVLFKNNEENGAFIEYHENGKLKAEGSYLNGDNEHGLLKLYDESGELEKKMNCVKGVCRTIWTKEGGDVEQTNDKGGGSKS